MRRGIINNIMNSPPLGSGSYKHPKRLPHSQHRQQENNRKYHRGLGHRGKEVIQSIPHLLLGERKANRENNIMKANEESSIESFEKEVDPHQVPVKIFEMQGGVRLPLRAEESPEAAKYRHEIEYQVSMGGGMSGSIRRTAGRKKRAMDRNSPQHNNQARVDGNIMAQKSEKLGSIGQKCSPIITTHPYRLGFLY